MMSPHRWIVAFLLVGATGAVAQEGQTARDAREIDDARIEEFRTVLARSDMPAEHAPLEADWRCRDSVPKVMVLEEGFARLASFELTADTADASRARDAFRCVVDGQSASGQPASKWAFLGLGLLETRRELAVDPALGFGALERAGRVLLGRTSGDKAREWLGRALEIDPALSEAAVAIGELALRSRNREDLREARSILQAVEDAGGGDVRSSVTRAEVENALGRVEDARVTLRESPQTDPLVLRARAEALLRSPGMEERGASAYFHGVEQLTPRAAERYFDDLRPIADSAEVDRWEEADFAGRRELLRGFWDIRAAAATVAVSDRLAEHYRRLAVADSTYYNPGWHKSIGTLALGPFRQKGRFDARGDMYVRHGEPDQVVQRANPGMARAGGGPGMNAECWVYHPRPGELNGIRTLMFAGSSRGFTLSLRGGCATMETYNPDYYDDRELIEQYRIARRTESFDPGFDRELPFAYQLYTFAGSEEGSAVVAALAIPADMLQADSVSGRPEYSVDASFIIFDHGTENVERTDTTFRFVADRPLQEGEVVRLYLELTVPPSDSAGYRVLVRNTAAPDHGQAYGGPTVVDSIPRAGLAMSDIALADPRAGGSWSRGEVRLALLGVPRIETEEFTLFYEIYDLAEGTPFRTTIEFEPVESGLGRVSSWMFGGRNPGAITFEGTAEPSADGVVREARLIQRSIEPGAYRIRVTVRDLESGAETSAKRMISIGSS